MNQTGGSSTRETIAAPDPGEAGAQLVLVLDQYMADLKAGQAPTKEALLAAHPDLASQLAQCLPGIEFIHQAATPTPRRLGDFELVGEVGRGGMGVVYEARQVSLNRRVALKVLRFGVVADTEAMERFQREAETVAQLHHTNIVPIFAMGSEHGVAYYAMQFIEGQSLAAVQEEARQQLRPHKPIQVAQWGLQAAEALGHAHDRGVIHRDIKPSNLLLDPDGRIWLTDFGLAKRIDDVALSMTGAVVGTPRYMSPEQASAAKHPVDQRTDIYSLGATLYELATGKPLFDGLTSHDVISQILTTEPRSPRLVRADLPRDLDTILVKCLSKDPRQRYATAKDLADDLRAFTESRPIKARRVRLAERMVRWGKKNRRNVMLAGAAAAAASIFIAVSVVGSSLYHKGRLGSLLLNTSGPSLVAEVLDPHHDHRVMPSFTIPMAEGLPLPEGPYRLRLSAKGLATETYDINVDRGNSVTGNLELQHQLICPVIDLGSSDTTKVVTLNDVSYIFRSKEHSVVLLDGTTAKPVWEWEAKSENGVTLYDRAMLRYESEQEPPEFVQPAPDVNGDGFGDLVLACRSEAALWALSGKTGAELWWFRAGPGQTIGVPAVADVDGDGVNDFVATFTRGKTGSIWIEAVSGKTGKSIWRYAAEDAWWQGAPGSRWAPSVLKLDGKSIVLCVVGTRVVALDLKTGAPAWPAYDVGIQPVVPPRIADLDGDGQPDLLIVGLEQPVRLSALAISLTTRMQLWKQTLREKQPADLANLWELPDSYKVLYDWPWVAQLSDGGRPDVIVPIVPTAPNTWADSRWSGVEALDGATGKPRWKHDIRIRSQTLCVDRLTVGPDVNGDGLRDLFTGAVAFSNHRQSVFVDALSGKDGQPLWWWKSDERDSFTVSGQSSSGSSNSLSSRNVHSNYPCVGPMRLWRQSAGGSPLLVVPTNLSGNGATFVISTTKGQLVQEFPDQEDLRGIADIDHDGVEDLVFRGPAYGNGLYAIKGVTPSQWRRLGDFQPAQDFDGDGLTDLLGSDAHHILLAINGRDGSILWQSRQGGQFSERICLPAPLGDLDGDGTADILLIGGQNSQTYYASQSGVTRFPRGVQAVSGKTGQLLWNLEDHPVACAKDGQFIGWSPQSPLCVDLDGHGKKAIAMAYELRYGSGSHQLWLEVASAADGKSLWRQPISGLDGIDVPTLPFEGGIHIGSGDIDGDGIQDFVLGVPRPPDKSKPGSDAPMWGCQLIALSGRDGKVLWRHDLPLALESYHLKDAMLAPVIADLNGDGKKQVIVFFGSEEIREGTRISVVSCVQSFDTTGDLLWESKRVDANFGFYSMSKRLFVTGADDHGQRSLCPIFASPGVVLDGRGKERPGFAGVIAASEDVDGDGNEELLFLAQGKLIVTHRDEKDGVLWEMPGVTGVQRVMHGKAGQSSTIVATTEKGAIGLDGATGKLLWRSAGSLDLVLADSAMPALPRLITRAQSSSNVTVCRSALPASGDPLPGALTPPPLRSQTPDPRIVRSLPWAVAISRLISSWETDPGPDHPPTPPYDPAFMMMLTLLIASLSLSIRWIYRRSWKKLAYFSLAVAVVTVAVAAIWLGEDSRGMNAIEHYAWSGWYWAVPFGLAAMGVVVLARLFFSTVRLAWRRRPFQTASAL